jgi:hypothetical protein
MRLPSQRDEARTPAVEWAALYAGLAKQVNRGPARRCRRTRPQTTAASAYNARLSAGDAE